jgi:RNA polymerase sigma-70 factor (ECF subfamily)
MMKLATDQQWRQLGADVGRLVARRLPTSAEVEDVVQEVLLRVWRQGGELADEERFGAWLARVAYNTAADYMRGRRRHPLPRHESREDDTPAPSAAPTASEPEAKEMIALVLRPFIEALPATYREAVALSELEELPHAAIAARLGLSVTAVKSRVRRGRAELRRMLERCCAIALDPRHAPISCEPRPDGVVPPGCCGHHC